MATAPASINEASAPNKAEPQKQGRAKERTAPNLETAISETERRKGELAQKEAEFEFQQRRASMFARSGLFPGGKDLDDKQAVAQAMVRIELGESMGFSAAESLQGVRVIAGECAIAAALRAARMQAAGYDWDIEWHWSGKPEASEVAGITMWLYYRGEPMIGRDNKQVSVSYLRADAEKMLTTLWEGGQKRPASILEKPNWKMSPKNMYFARCVTNAQRWYAPSVLSVNIQSVEEAMDTDTDQEVAGSRRAATATTGKTEALRDSLESGQREADRIREKLRNTKSETPGTSGPAPITTSDIPVAAKPWLTDEEREQAFFAIRAKMVETYKNGAAEYARICKLHGNEDPFALTEEQALAAYDDMVRGVETAEIAAAAAK